MTATTPRYPVDLFTDEALQSATEHYQNLRELGPIVWLEAHDAYVLPRYAEVRAALSNAETYCSGQGVALNDLSNSVAAGRNLLMTDGVLHDHLRKVLASGLTPRALRHVQEQVDRQAEALVSRLAAQGEFDAVADLAQALPLAVVPDLVGWPAEGREHLLGWAAAAFDLLGPLNERAQAAIPQVQAMQRFAAQIAQDGSMQPGSVGAGVIEAARTGVIEPDRVAALIIGYLAPSLDTTISAIASAVWLLASHPEQWELLKADPSLVPNAFNEVVRLESPLRTFSRVTTAEVQIGGVCVPAGSRVLVHYASANRDERQFAGAETFDITRVNAAEHLGFGQGVHGCAGQGLARMEGQAVLAALVRHVDSWTLRDGAVRGLNNIINFWATLPVSVTPQLGVPS